MVASVAEGVVVLSLPLDQDTWAAAEAVDQVGILAVPLVVEFAAAAVVEVSGQLVAWATMVVLAVQVDQAYKARVGFGTNIAHELEAGAFDCRTVVQVRQEDTVQRGKVGVAVAERES